jgi:molybdate transport system substrate-binding protein
LADAGLVDEGSARTFARNRLVVVLPPDNPAGLTSLRDLARPGVRLIVADPAVPAGKYTVRALDSLAGDAAWGPEFRDAVLANVASQEETVRAVLAKVELGEADAGFVYLSDASRAAQLLRLDLPPGSSPLAEYPIARLLQSPHASLAQTFIDFALSVAGQRIMEAHGFLPATD